MAGINEFTGISYSYKVSEGGSFPTSFPELVNVKKVYHGTNADSVVDNPLLLLNQVGHQRDPAFEFYRFKISADKTLGKEALFIRTTVLVGFMFTHSAPNFDFYSVLPGFIDPLKYIQERYDAASHFFGETDGRPHMKSWDDDKEDFVPVRQGLKGLYQIVLDYYNHSL